MSRADKSKKALSKSKKGMSCRVGRDLAWASSPYSVAEKRLFCMLLMLAKNDSPKRIGYECEFGSFALNSTSKNMVTGSVIPATYSVRLSLRHILGASFRGGKKYNNLKYAAEVVRSFNEKSVRLYTKTGWVEAPPFSLILGETEGGYVDLIVQSVVWERFKDESSGYNTVEMSALLSLNSKYAMDNLMMLAGLQHPITISIEYMRDKWDLEGKYPSTYNLIKNTFAKGMIELDSKGLGFSYRVEKESTSKTSPITGITIYPKNRRAAAQISAAKKYGLERFIPKQELSILRMVLNDEGIANNIQTIRNAVLNSAYSGPFIIRLTELCMVAKGKKNPGGWLIHMLQQEPKRQIRPLLIAFPETEESSAP